MKTSEGTRSQIKKATSPKEVKRIFRDAQRKEQQGEYDFARAGYIGRLESLVKRRIKELADVRK